MNKTVWVTGLVCVLVVMPRVWAQENEKEKTTSRGSTADVSHEMHRDFPAGSQDAAADLLRQRVASVNWNDETLEGVLDWLQTQGEGRVNVVAKWGPLGIESVKNDSTIGLQLNNTTVADVLHEVVEQLSENGAVRYRGIGNKLTISTKADFEKNMVVRVYDLADLLFRAENFGPEAPKIDLQKTSRSGTGGGQSPFTGSGTGSQTEDTERVERENEERLTKLRRLIEQTIAPETWDVRGGEESPTVRSTGDRGGQGRIRVLNTSLIVLNTLEVHEMIAGPAR